MSDRHKGEFDDETVEEAEANREKEPDEESLSRFHGAADDLEWDDEGGDDEEPDEDEETEGEEEA